MQMTFQWCHHNSYASARAVRRPASSHRAQPPPPPTVVGPTAPLERTSCEERRRPSTLHPLAKTTASTTENHGSRRRTPRWRVPTAQKAFRAAAGMKTAKTELGLDGLGARKTYGYGASPCTLTTHEEKFSATIKPLSLKQKMLKIRVSKSD